MEYTDTNTGETLYEWDLHYRYDEWLSECYPPINVCGLRYAAAEVLKHTDPTAYRRDFLDWIDSEEKKGNLEEVTIMTPTGS